MDRLVEVIGKAPSEMTIEECREKLLRERERVREALEDLRNGKVLRGKGRKKEKKKEGTGGKRKKRKEKSLAEQALSLLTEKGISLEELEKVLKEE